MTTHEEHDPIDHNAAAPTLGAEQDLPNVHQAMAHAMRLLRAVGKWGQNREQGYAFRSIDHLMTALKPAMAQAGVHVVPRVLQRITDDTHTTRGGSVLRWVDVEMAFTFYGPDGSCVEAVTWGEARDAADKATNKAMTGAFKYAVLQAFMVPTEDLLDADSESPEAQPPQQQNATTISTADPHTVDLLRDDLLDATVQHAPGADRERVLRALWDEAASKGALGCQVDVPVGWQRDGPTAVALHQLITGSLNVSAHHGEDDPAQVDPWADDAVGVKS